MNWPEAMEKLRTDRYSGVTPTTWLATLSLPTSISPKVLISGATVETLGEKTGSRRLRASSKVRVALSLPPKKPPSLAEPGLTKSKLVPSSSMREMMLS